MAKGKKITLPSADHGPPDVEKWLDRRPYWQGWNIYTPEANAHQIDFNFPKIYKVHPDRNRHWFCFYNYYRYSCPFYHDERRTEKPFAYHTLAKQHLDDWLKKYPNDANAIAHHEKMVEYINKGEIVIKLVNGYEEVVEYKPNSLMDCTISKPILGQSEVIEGQPNMNQVYGPLVEMIEPMSAEQKNIEAQSSIVPNNLGDQTFPTEKLDTYMSNDQFIEYLKEQNKLKEAQIESLTKERKMFTSELMELIRKWIK